MFNIGEKVVCINDAFPAWVHDTYNQLPTKGEVYTVRGTDLGRSDLSSDSAVSFKVLLEELKNDDEVTASGRNLGELGFKSDRFATMDQLESTEYLVATQDEPTTVIVT